MNWTKKDKHLFTIVNQSGKYHLERQIQDATDKYFTLKTIPSYYVIFGYYNLNNHTFYWENNMNNISYEITKQNHMNIFGSKHTIKKLFKKEVRFDSEYMHIIPYLMEALNEDLNVIRIKSDNVNIYALTKLDGIYRSFNYCIFEEALHYYRNEEETIKKIKNTAKKEPDVFECKENL